MKFRIPAVAQLVTAALIGVTVGRYGSFDVYTISEHLRSDLRRTVALFSPAISQSTALESVFTDPARETSFYYRPIESMTDLYERNKELAIDASLFDQVYPVLQNIDVTPIKRNPNEIPVVKVRFQLNGTEKYAFVYGLFPKRCDKSTGKAALVIPGSGLNQSLAIFTGESGNYQKDLFRVFQRNNFSSFVLIKPNEAYLAWHNGRGAKVNGSVIYNWHLNRRSSYSAAYIVQAMAVMKWMKNCFGRTILAGISQGGAAALLAGLQAEPDIAIVSSGFSLLTDSLELSGQNQISGVALYGDLHNPEKLSSILGASRTEWVFTWGMREQDIYGVEAQKSTTARAIGRIKNVHWRSIKQGHTAPAGLIDSLLRAKSQFANKHQ